MTWISIDMLLSVGDPTRSEAHILLCQWIFLFWGLGFYGEEAFCKIGSFQTLVLWTSWKRKSALLLGFGRILRGHARSLHDAISFPNWWWFAWVARLCLVLIIFIVITLHFIFVCDSSEVDVLCVFVGSLILAFVLVV